MSIDYSNIRAELSRSLPSKKATSQALLAALAGTGLGELRVAGKTRRQRCEDGVYFIACNPTPGTGIAGHAAPTDVTSVLKPLVQVNNGTSSTSGQAKRIILDYIKLTVTAAGTNGTNCLFAEEIDTGDRYTSGGSQLTPLNTNMDADNPSSSDIVIYAGAVVAPAAGASQREIGSGLVRTVIPVVGDVYFFAYGWEGLVPQAATVVSGTAPAAITIMRPPVVLGPQQVFNHHQAQASQSAASSFEIEVAGWME